MRTMAPAHDLAPAESLAVIYAIGDSNKIEASSSASSTSSRAPVSCASSTPSRTIIICSSTISLFAPFAGASRGRVPRHQSLHLRGHGAEAEGSEHARQRRSREADASLDRRGLLGAHRCAECRGKKILSYTARGEGTSPRAVSLSPDERDVAFEQAARYAAVSAAEGITPRRVRETIEFDENAPSFDDGFAMVSSERLEDARAIWQAAARRHRDSAPLYFNLGAVSEAIGDLRRE